MRGALTLTTVLAVVAAPACSSPADAPPAASEAIIGARGPATQIAADDGWRLVAQDSVAGPCLQLFANDDSGYGCGFGVPELHSIGYFPTLLGQQRFLAGPVTSDVDRVRVELRDGSRIHTDVMATEEGLHVYVVRVPAGELQRLVALSSDRQEIERLETPSDPWGS